MQFSFKMTFAKFCHLFASMLAVLFAAFCPEHYVRWKMREDKARLVPDLQRVQSDEAPAERDQMSGGDVAVK